MWLFRRLTHSLLGYTPIPSAFAGEEAGITNPSVPLSTFIDDQDQEPFVSGADEAIYFKHSHLRSMNHSSLTKLLAKIRFWVLVIISGCFAVIVPSFLRSTRSGCGNNGRKLMSTAWLDGLRGVAALLVVFHHASLMLYPWWIHSAAFQSPPSDNTNKPTPPPASYWIQYPWIRLLISGPPQVAVFFVVSGYALSYRPLSLLSSGQHTVFSDSITSGLARRHPRLFIPAVTSSLASAFLTYLGVYGTKDQVIHGVAQEYRSPPRAETPLFGSLLLAQLQSWWRNTLKVIDPFQASVLHGTGNAYDGNQWTLPVEYLASLLIFLMLMGTSRFSPTARYWTFVAVAGWLGYQAYWPPLLFVGGMVVAQGRVMKEQPVVEDAINTTPTSNSPSTPLYNPEKPLFQKLFSLVLLILHKTHRKFQQSPRLTSFLKMFSFLLSIHFLSTPGLNRGAKHAWGYQTMTTHIPTTWSSTASQFWPVIGALLIVATLDVSPKLQRIFTTSLAQYLGKISYALYLVHGACLFSVGRPLAVYLNTRLGVESDDGGGGDGSGIITADKIGGMRYGVVVISVFVVTAPVIVVVADAGTRYVDEKTVKGLKQAYKWLVTKK